MNYIWYKSNYQLFDKELYLYKWVYYSVGGTHSADTIMTFQYELFYILYSGYDYHVKNEPASYSYILALYTLNEYAKTIKVATFNVASLI
jgi:hypothetical protein